MTEQAVGKVKHEVVLSSDKWCAACGLPVSSWGDVPWCPAESKSAAKNREKLRDRFGVEVKS